MKSNPYRVASMLILGTLALATADLAVSQGTDGGPSAADQGNEVGLQEIVVTAEKRSERINDVPISITAVTGDRLQSQGITDLAELTKVVPGFTYQASAYGNPIYTIRGIGFDAGAGDRGVSLN